MASGSVFWERAHWIECFALWLGALIASLGIKNDRLTFRK